MFRFNKDVIPTDCEPGVTRKILCYSDDLMMCEISFKKGSKGNFHKHEHLQITYFTLSIASGRIKESCPFMDKLRSAFSINKS